MDRYKRTEDKRTENEKVIKIEQTTDIISIDNSIFFHLFFFSKNRALLQAHNKMKNKQ